MSTTAHHRHPLVSTLLPLLLALPTAASGEEPAASVTPAASATPADSPTPSTPAPPAEKQMIIWGGGTTREQAEKSLASYKEAGGGWEKYYALAEGYPRILESKTVAGLKPGFFIVVLGVCPVTQDSLVLDTFKAFTPAVYARSVTWNDESPSCPKASGDSKVAQVRRWKKKGLELTAVEVNKGKEEWLLQMVLRDKAGKELESYSTDSKEAESEGISCRSSVYFEDSGPGVSLGCDLPGCTTMASATYDIRYRIEGEKIGVEKEQTSYTPGECD